MSSGNVDEVRQRIIRLAREIEEMSQQRMPVVEYFEGFLSRVVAAVGARAGAVWLGNGSHQLDLIADLQLEKTGFHQNPNAQRINFSLLQDVLSNGQACTHSPSDGKDTELPTEDLIILGALQQSSECVGVVEIFQRLDTPAQARGGFLQFIEQMCGHACGFLDRQLEKDVEPVARSKFSETLEEFTLQLHRSLNPVEVAATCANDGRLLLGCDRLSVAVQVGPRTDIKAISGQSSVNQKSNLVRAMRKLTGRVLAMREPLIYTGKLQELPPQIEEPLAEYVHESGSRMVQVIPLYETEPLVDLAEDARGPREVERPRRVVGGLVVEQVAESRPKPDLADRIEVVKDHVAGALANAMRHERLFGMKLWRFLGHSLAWFEGRNRWKAGFAVAVVVAIGLVLALVPWDYRVEASGRLMPVVQQDIFAPDNGKVVEIFVVGGQEVEGPGPGKKGDKLIRLVNLELETQLKGLFGDMQSNQQLLLTLQAQYDRAVSGDGTEKDEIELAGEIRKARIEAKSLGRRYRNLLDRREELTIRAGHDGVVATFQVKQKLINRPVNRGEKLLEIMNVKDKWRLELQIEEHRMGHVLRYLREQKDALPVEFVLATATEHTYYGRLDANDIASRINLGDGGTSVAEVFVTPMSGSGELPQHRIGAEVSAKIHCGQRSLFYVIFGDVVEFVRKQFWW